MITSLFEDIVNHLLDTDPQCKARLSALAGRSFGICVSNTPITLLAKINPEGLACSMGAIDDADCLLRGTPISLMRYLSADQINPATNVALNVETEGDLEFARKVAFILRELDIDWEAVFAPLIGDFSANQLGRVVSRARADLVNSKNAALQHLGYLIKERSDQLVTAAEAEKFYQDVDNLVTEAQNLERLYLGLTGTGAHD